MTHDSARISPTAHYTGYAWLAHGLSDPAFATPTGQFLYRALGPANRLMRAAGQPNLDGFLLARHHMIDAVLRAAIERGEIGQVIEVACGLSPRGWRFAREFGDRVTYVEADLPGMAAKKRAVLAKAGAGGAHHRVVEIDATADAGPASVAALAETLDPARGTAIITEGLLNYFDPVAVAKMWRRFAGALARFPHGLYLADLHLAEAAGPVERLFAGALGVFVRGRIHFHFSDARAAERELGIAGFRGAELIDPSTRELPELDRTSARFVRVVAAST
ncbi:MAG: class I SAM-dependent methyltransferase [Myxococcales bacterium]|nr:class I SAM-dependent methyltransferase [Myxococcales bacterium]